MPRIALVTGASSGIAAATARLLQRDGYRVAAVARHLDRMQDLAAIGVDTFAMDVTDEESRSAGVERILDEHGRLDLLVNSAGHGSHDSHRPLEDVSVEDVSVEDVSVEDVSIEDARHRFEVDLFGPARLVQLVLPTMRAQGYGRIITLGLGGGRIHQPGGAWRHATQSALAGFSDSLRRELKPLGISVALVEPGRATESEVVARTVRKVATVKRPHARYPVGRGARLVAVGRASGSR